MAFPDLTLRPNLDSPTGQSALWAEATGTPDPGDNTFRIPFVDQPPLGSGVPAEDVQEDWLVINVYPLGAGLTAVALGSPLLDPDRENMTLNFTTDGVTQARVVVQLVHSTQR